MAGIARILIALALVSMTGCDVVTDAATRLAGSILTIDLERRGGRPIVTDVR